MLIGGRPDGLLAFQLPPLPEYFLLAGLGMVVVGSFRGDLTALAKRVIVLGWGMYALTSPSAQFPRILKALPVAIFGAGVAMHMVARPVAARAKDRAIALSSRMIVVYIAFVLLGAFASPFGPHNLIRWVEGVTIIAAGFYAVWLGLTRQVLVATWIACLLNVMLAVASGRQEITPGGTLPDGRLAGYLDPNHLAFAAAEVIIGVIWIWPRARRVAVPFLGRFSIRPLLLASAAISTYALLASRSRTTLFGVLIAMAIASFSGVRVRGRRTKVLLIAFVAAVLLVPLVAPAVSQYASRGESGSSVTSLTGRTDFWPYAVDLIKERPLIGWGLDVVRSPAGVKLQAVLPGIQQAHNAFLEAALQAGLIGATAWAISLLAATVGAFRLPRDDPFRWLLIVLLLLTIVESITESSPAWFGDMFVVYVLALALFGDRYSRRQPVPALAPGEPVRV